MYKKPFYDRRLVLYIKHISSYLPFADLPETSAIRIRIFFLFFLCLIVTYCVYI